MTERMHDDLTHPTKIGPYTVAGPIGHGASGTVYRCVGPSGDGVALKLLHAALRNRPDVLRRFDVEAAVMARVVHPNLVRVLDQGSHDGLPYIVLELLEGEDLRHALAGGRRFTTKEAIGLVIPVLAALGALHDSRLFHRDVKPENVFLLRSGSVKVMDLGLVRVPESTLTLDGALIGTPAHMSPEQAEGRPVDRRTDLFATGIVLFELLAGANPFSAADATSAMEKVRRCAIDFELLPRELRSTPLTATLRRVLSRQPADRYASAQEFREALERAWAQTDKILSQEHAPTLTRPPQPAPTAVPAVTPPSDERTRVVLVTSASGTRRGEAVRRIGQALSAWQEPVEIVDFEEDCLLPTIRARLAERGLIPFRGWGPEDITLERVVEELPPDAVSHYWRVALEEAAKRVHAAKSALVVLSLHLTYYRPKHFEFYTPVATHELLRQVRIVRVITLIDDIYDMYVRLSDNGRIFDIASLVRREYDRREREGAPLPETPGKRYLLALAQVVKTLMRLLLWREKEILAGEMLAADSACDHKVLAVKHPATVGAALVAGATPADDVRDVYLSHPISRPRRERNADGKWPLFVEEFHEFIDSVSQRDGRHVALVMPTAIDEYRLLHDRDASTDIFIPVLAERWPLHGTGQRWPGPQRVEHLMYSLPTKWAEYGAYERAVIQEIFNPPIDRKGTAPLWPPGMGVEERSVPDAVKGEVSGLLRALILAITQQMAERDLNLVRQSPGVLLYRPLFQEQDWSGGVEAEVSSWTDIVTCGVGGSVPFDRRRIVFLHAPVDTAAVDREALSSSGLGTEVLAKARELLPGFPERLAERLLRSDFGQADWVDVFLKDTGSALNAGDIPPALEHEIRSRRLPLQEAAEAAKGEALRIARSRNAGTTQRGGVRVYSDLVPQPMALPEGVRELYWSDLARRVLGALA